MTTKKTLGYMCMIDRKWKFHMNSCILSINRVISRNWLEDVASTNKSWKAYSVQRLKSIYPSRQMDFLCNFSVSCIICFYMHMTCSFRNTNDYQIPSLGIKMAIGYASHINNNANVWRFERLGRSLPLTFFKTLPSAQFGQIKISLYFTLWWCN